MRSRRRTAWASAWETSCRSATPSKRSWRPSSPAGRRPRRDSTPRWPRATRSSRSSRPPTSHRARSARMARVVFKHRGLPYLLVLPQVLVTLVFFIWPAFESLRLSLFRTSPFGDKTVFVGLDNFAKLLASPEYYESVVATVLFSGGVTALAVGGGLVVAALATQNVRGLAAYRTAVLWPY